jgi:FtsP/CotA-like multicopper oxidase with cupredoxin domain
MVTRATKLIGSSFFTVLLTVVLAFAPVLARPTAPQRIAAPVAAPRTAPSAAPVTVNLCASTGSVTMPDGAVIGIWGFSLDTGSCGPAQVPGPVLEVNEGDVVTVNLTNNLSENVSILFPGQDLMPDTTGASGGGGTTSYTFTAKVGTYLYEAGTNPGVQTSMGLYGALVVNSATAGQAYADPGTAYDASAVLVLSEIDPALNANPGGFDFQDYAPQYWLINGAAYPGTANVTAAPGQRLLLRYLNAGQTHHTMQLLGLHQRVIAKDGFPSAFPFDAISETIPAGQTMDAIATVPAGAAVGDTFPLYNRQMHLINGGPASSPHAPGGMMTFIEVGGAPANTPPVVTITSPADLSTFTFGDSVTFTGTAMDTQDGDISASLTWSSDLDGAIGSGGTFSTTTLSVGTHLITATATDSGTLTGSASITVTITAPPGNTPPTASISTPADLSSFTAGDSVTFTGAGSDVEDGDVTASLTWSSDLDGAIGSGGTFSTTTLSVGTHLITATATDSGTLTGSASITITVNLPATMHIGAMTDASVNSPPTSVLFWTAGVTITIHDASHTPVGAGITVTGVWSGPGPATPAGALTCITNASGLCTVTRVRGELTAPTATFTVSGVSGGSLTYTPGDDHAGPGLTVPNPPGT